MRQLSISLVSLGSLKHPVDTQFLEKWKSALFKIQHGASIGHLPNSSGLSWEYTDEQLIELIQPEGDADITIGLINSPLEDNFYMRRLTNQVAILSLHEMAEIVDFFHFTIENYILRNIYEVAVLYAANGKLLPSDSHSSWPHDDVRGCLFDMNSNKRDIIFSMHKPKLCAQCNTRVMSKQINSGFLPTLDKELSKIKKALFFRMMEWVKLHPVWTLIITFISAIASNLVASLVYDKLL